MKFSNAPAPWALGSPRPAPWEDPSLRDREKAILARMQGKSHAFSGPEHSHNGHPKGRPFAEKPFAGRSSSPKAPPRREGGPGAVRRGQTQRERKKLSPGAIVWIVIVLAVLAELLFG